MLTLKVTLQLRSRRGDRRRCENSDEGEELGDKLHGVGLVRLWRGLGEGSLRPDDTPKASLYHPSAAAPLDEHRREDVCQGVLWQG